MGAALVAVSTVICLARRRQKQPSHYVSTIELDDEYRLLYSNEEAGINSNIKVYSSGTSPIDIKMTDVNENVVWKGSKAIGPNSSRTFWCGEDVAKVYARTSADCQCDVYV